MIISQRSDNPSYTTDAVAASLRTVVAPTALRASAPRAAARASKAPIDFALLYPAIFTETRRPSLIARSVRAVAFRLSVFGTAAAMLAFLHR